MTLLCPVCSEEFSEESLREARDDAASDFFTVLCPQCEAMLTVTAVMDVVDFELEAAK